MKNSYVSALTESILAGDSVETVLASLRELMTKRGHLRLYSQVLKAATRVLEAKLKSSAPQVVMAKVDGVAREKILTALKLIGAKDDSFAEAVDPTLVGGFTARVGDTFYDASYKRVLLKLYRQVTS